MAEPWEDVITFTGMPTLEEILNEITHSPPASAYPELYPERKFFQAICANNNQAFIFFVQDISIYQYLPQAKDRPASFYRNLGVYYKFNLCEGVNSWERKTLMYFSPDRAEFAIRRHEGTQFLESLTLNPETE